MHCNIGPCTWIRMVFQLCNLPLVHCFGVVFFATEVLRLVNGLVQVTSLHTQGQWYGTSTGKEVFRTWQITYVELHSNTTGSMTAFHAFFTTNLSQCHWHLHQMDTVCISVIHVNWHLLLQLLVLVSLFCEFQQLMLLHEWSLWCIYHGSSTFWWVGWGDLYIAYTDACPVIYMYK